MTMPCWTARSAVLSVFPFLRELNWGSVKVVEQDSGDHGQVAGGVGNHGHPQGTSTQAAERENGACPSQKQDHKCAGDNAEMEARSVLPESMHMEVHQAEAQSVDQGSEGGIPAARKSLLDEATEEYLLADRGEDQGRQGDDGEGGGWGHHGEHLTHVEAVADAKVLVLGQGAVECHTDGEDGQAAACPGQCAEGQCGRGIALFAEANFPPPERCEEDERQGPHHQAVKQKQDAGPRWAEDGVVACGSQNRQHAEREKPERNREPAPGHPAKTGAKEAGLVGGFRAHDDRSLLLLGH